jgi:hypothetical protein
MRRDFCVYFDHRYFDRGMAMYESLVRHCPQARLFVLCLSETCHTALTCLSLPNLVPIRLETFEAENPALTVAKANRSLVEYYFTCTPSLVDWLMRTRPEIEMLSYLDGDLYFFSDPQPLFEAFEGYSSLIIAHRFPPQRKFMEAYGLYNVGWLSFRRDADGLACLSWWRDRCLEWCYDRLEGDRFADQKYLDRFPELFRRVLVLEHPGANLAPWNLGRHALGVQDGHILVDGRPLIFFHFQGFRRLFGPLWRLRHRENFVPRSPVLAPLLYRPYIRAMARARALGIEAGLRDNEPILRRGFSMRGRLRDIASALFYRDFVLGWP